jgi:hypothetical protein
MKTFTTLLFTTLFATSAFANEVNFDGCKGVKVEGTNYYNLVDPRCKTEASKYETTGAEETKKLAAEEAANATQE